MTATMAMKISNPRRLCPCAGGVSLGQLIVSGNFLPHSFCFYCLYFRVGATALPARFQAAFEPLKPVGSCGH
jgi:hypothetical protein